MIIDRDGKKIFKITHKIELLLWLILILMVVIFSSIALIHKEKDSEHDYKVFLPDADGLIVGSPVKMMGIEVGHVVKIKPIKDEVYVKFILTNPDVYIPQGTQITVEFSGMAGSKSLELYLPDENTYVDSNTQLFTVLPPKRLNESVSLLGTMYKKFASIIYTSSSFGKNDNIEEQKESTPKKSNAKKGIIFGMKNRLRKRRAASGKQDRIRK